MGWQRPAKGELVGERKGWMCNTGLVNERGVALYLIGGGADWEVKLAPMWRTLYTIDRDQADEDGRVAEKVV